jgi:hypothetical protein
LKEVLLKRLFKNVGVFLLVATGMLFASNSGYSAFTITKSDGGFFDLVVAVEDPANGDNKPAVNSANCSYSPWTLPTGECMQQHVEAIVRSFAKDVYEITNGAHRLRNVKILKNATSRGNADIFLFTAPSHGSGYDERTCPNGDCTRCSERGANYFAYNGVCINTGFRSSATLGGFQSDGGISQSLREAWINKLERDFRVYPVHVAGRVLAHEFLHYAYALRDHYANSHADIGKSIRNDDCDNGVIYDENSENIFPDMMYDGYRYRIMADLEEGALTWEYGEFGKCGLALTAHESQFDYAAPLQGKKCSWSMMKADHMSSWEKISSFGSGVELHQYPGIAAKRPLKTDLCTDYFGVHPYVKTDISSSLGAMAALQYLNMSWDQTWNPPATPAASIQDAYALWAIVPSGVKGVIPQTSLDSQFAERVLQTRESLMKWSEAQKTDFGLFYAPNTGSVNFVEKAGMNGISEYLANMPIESNDMSLRVFFTKLAQTVNSLAQSHSKVELNLIYPLNSDGLDYAGGIYAFNANVKTERFVLNGYFGKASHPARVYHNWNWFMPDWKDRIGLYANLSTPTPWSRNYDYRVGSTEYKLSNSEKTIVFPAGFYLKTVGMKLIVEVWGKYNIGREAYLNSLVLKDQNDRKLSCKIIDLGVYDGWLETLPYLECDGTGEISSVTVESPQDFYGVVSAIFRTPMVSASALQPTTLAGSYVPASFVNLSANAVPVVFGVNYQGRAVAGAVATMDSSAFLIPVNDNGVWPDRNAKDGVFAGILRGDSTDTLSAPVSVLLGDSAYYIPVSADGIDSENMPKEYVGAIDSFQVLIPRPAYSAPVQDAYGCDILKVTDLLIQEDVVLAMPPSGCVRVNMSSVFQVEIAGPGAKDLDLACAACDSVEGYGVSFKADSSFVLKNNSSTPKSAVISFIPLSVDTNTVANPAHALKIESSASDSYFRVRGVLKALPSDSSRSLQVVILNPSKISLDEASVWYKASGVDSINVVNQNDRSIATIFFKDGVAQEWQTEFLFGLRGKAWESLDLRIEGVDTSHTWYDFE